MNAPASPLHTFLFTVYPYIALAVFLLGSLVRFDREPYTWKSDSSQMLAPRRLNWASNLFHAGILFLLVGHTVGMLTPHALYAPFITAAQKQMLAIVAGGIAGAMCFVGLTGLIVRRVSEPRVRAAAHRTDLPILVLLWLQLVLGLATLPLSLGHRDGSVMLALSHWAQGIVTLQPDAGHLAGVAWPYLLHLVLGMSLFLLVPFTRLVHVWSGLASVGYVLRPYQLVRSRRLNLGRAADAMRLPPAAPAGPGTAAAPAPRVWPARPAPVAGVKPATARAHRAQ